MLERVLLGLVMVSFMMENGMETLEKDLVFKFGPMELDMKVIGRITRRMEMESSFTWMEIYIKGNG